MLLFLLLSTGLVPLSLNVDISLVNTSLLWLRVYLLPWLFLMIACYSSLSLVNILCSSVLLLGLLSYLLLFVLVDSSELLLTCFILSTFWILLMSSLIISYCPDLFMVLSSVSWLLTSTSSFPHPRIELLAYGIHAVIMMVYMLSFIVIVTLVLQFGLYGVHSSSITVSTLLIVSLIMVSGIPPSIVLLVKLASILTYAIAFKMLLLLYLFYMLVFLLTMGYFIRLVIMALFTNSLLLTRV